MSATHLGARISTNALRGHLQRCYLAQHQQQQAGVSGDAAAEAAIAAHNGDRGGHKLLNNVYVLAHRTRARPVTPYAAVADGSSVAADVASNDKEASVGKKAVNGATTHVDADPIVALLGHKARGFGAGLWNGFGGKVDIGVDASITASAARELEEEVGLSLAPLACGDDTYVRPTETALLDRSRGTAGESSDAVLSSISNVCRHVGILFFQYPVDKQPLTFEVHVYCVDGDDAALVRGQPVESEEMHPVAWFAESAVPIEQMWADDPEWLPQLLSVVCNKKHAVTKNNIGTTTASADSDAVPPSTSIARNIDDAAFVGYVDFVTMSDVRGSYMLHGKEAVAAVARDMVAASASSADVEGRGVAFSSAEEALLAKKPLLFFENEKCPIH